MVYRSEQTVHYLCVAVECVKQKAWWQAWVVQYTYRCSNILRISLSAGFTHCACGAMVHLRINLFRLLLLLYLRCRSHQRRWWSYESYKPECLAGLGTRCPLYTDTTHLLYHLFASCDSLPCVENRGIYTVLSTCYRCGLGSWHNQCRLQRLPGVMATLVGCLLTWGTVLFIILPLYNDLLSQGVQPLPYLSAYLALSSCWMNDPRDGSLPSAPCQWTWAASVSTWTP